MAWWYFSFVDAWTQEFLGAAVIEAATREKADMRALTLLKNPPERVGVWGFALKGIVESELPSPPNRNRLLTHEELKKELGDLAQFEQRGNKLVEVKDN